MVTTKFCKCFCSEPFFRDITMLSYQFLGRNLISSRDYSTISTVGSNPESLNQMINELESESVFEPAVLCSSTTYLNLLNTFWKDFSFFKEQRRQLICSVFYQGKMFRLTLTVLYEHEVYLGKHQIQILPGSS